MSMRLPHLAILYQDQAVVVVNKPGGLLAVPGRGPEKQDSVVSRLKAHFPDCIAQPSVHRLDMATSGLMVLALTANAHRDVSMQFEQRKVIKRYVALVQGQVKGEQGRIDLRFRLDPDNRPYQVYDEISGKRGVTLWKVIGREALFTRVEFFPQTGRTHQLRLHASHEKGLGRPILGDALYGTGRDGDKMMLHATGLQFVHPESKEVLCFFSAPPF